MKAYSYIRFSTPEQLKGNSLQRQLDASKKYAEENGLTLDTSLNLRDLGLSAYHGAHRTKGALGLFLDLVERGKIVKGSVLIVENLDRLSRQEPLEAFTQFTLIIQAGIKLVTLTDRQEYTRESIKKNTGQLWMSLGSMIRAFEESERKSQTLKSAWKAKRKSGMIVTAKCPAWLQVVKDADGNKKFKPREDVVRAIKRIFELKLQGIGEERIALALNSDPTFWQPPQNGRNKQGGWRKSYIAKILRNREVIGEFTHHQLVQTEEGEKPKEDQRFKHKKKLLGTTRQKVSDPIPNYYPQIIDEKTFNRTKYLIEEKLKREGFNGGYTGKANNLFAHLVQCALCDGPLHYIDKGRPPKGGQYLHCDNSRRKLEDDQGRICDAMAIRYDEFQDIFFNDLRELDLSKFSPGNEGLEKEIDSVQANIEDYKQRLSDVNKKVNNLVDRIEETGDTDLVTRLQERKRERLELQKHIKDSEHTLRDALEKSQNQHKALDVVKEIKQLLDQAKDEDERINLRLRIRAELQRLIERIKVYPCGSTGWTPQPSKDRVGEKVRFDMSDRGLEQEMIVYRYNSKCIAQIWIEFKGVEKVRILMISNDPLDVDPFYWGLPDQPLSGSEDNKNGDADNKKPIKLGS